MSDTRLPHRNQSALQICSYKEVRSTFKTQTKALFHIKCFKRCFADTVITPLPKSWLQQPSFKWEKSNGDKVDLIINICTPGWRQSMNCMTLSNRGFNSSSGEQSDKLVCMHYLQVVYRESTMNWNNEIQLVVLNSVSSWISQSTLIVKLQDSHCGKNVNILSTVGNQFGKKKSENQT